MNCRVTPLPSEFPSFVLTKRNVLEVAGFPP